MGDMDVLASVVDGRRDYMAGPAGRRHPTMLKLEDEGLIVWVSDSGEMFGGVWTATAKALKVLRLIRKREELEEARSSVRAWEEELAEADKYVREWSKRVEGLERELAEIEVCDG